MTLGHFDAVLNRSSIGARLIDNGPDSSQCRSQLAANRPDLDRVTDQLDDKIKTCVLTNLVDNIVQADDSVAFNPIVRIGYGEFA